jgi:hypothetical protein
VAKSGQRIQSNGRAFHVLTIYPLLNRGWVEKNMALFSGKCLQTYKQTRSYNQFGQFADLAERSLPAKLQAPAFSLEVEAIKMAG